MPKYCSVPNCRSDGSDGRSFYRFPLQDPVRLQQWLGNMGRENWTPSRHQYVCHEHFSPSCFRVRWGIRYLESDAVPTVFQESQKRKAADHSERKPKRLRDHRNQNFSEPSNGTVTFKPVEIQGALHTVHLYEFAVDQQAEMGLLEPSGLGEPDCSIQTDLDSLQPSYQTDDLSNMESVEVVVMSERPAGDQEDELVHAILNQGSTLVLKEFIVGCSGGSTAVQDVSCSAEDLSQVHEGQEVIAYFETMPGVFPSETSSQLAFSPDTVLSPALSSKPISSTLPIVSKHIPPSSLVLTLERLDTEEEDEEEGGEGTSEVEDNEQRDRQLEEHRYHKNSLSKEQLEAIVAGLQKKVKVLQQRHRRHLEKLLGLENTVSQLRQSNLLNEERLQLLERAYVQTSTAAPDVGETVAIIYEEDNAAYLYTPANDAGAMGVENA
uniref:Protein phosphatase 5, catalytic subunit n=1 Tax=Nothobranchius korthausae TaxID=1143690 RepID=A0A1A8FHU5_9TELE